MDKQISIQSVFTSISVIIVLLHPIQRILVVILVCVLCRELVSVNLWPDYFLTTSCSREGVPEMFDSLKDQFNSLTQERDYAQSALEAYRVENDKLALENLVIKSKKEVLELEKRMLLDERILAATQASIQEQKLDVMTTELAVLREDSQQAPSLNNFVSGDLLEENETIK